MKSTTQPYFKRIDRLTKEEVLLWEKSQYASRNFSSPFLTYEFAQAVSHAGRISYIAFLYDADGALFLFPFEFRTFLDSVLRIPSRIGGKLSDSMSSLSLESITPQPELLLKLFHGIEFDHARTDTWLIGKCEERNLRTGWELLLDCSLDDYWNERGIKHRQRIANLANRRRKVSREIGELRLIETRSPAMSQITRLIKVKQQQYVRSGVSDVFADKTTLRIIEGLSQLNGPGCRLVLSELFAGDNWLAAHLGLQTGNTLHYWFPTFDDAYRSYSPGLILIEEIVHKMPRNGLRRIDFGEGDSDYKRLFATADYNNFRGLVWKPSLRGLLSRLVVAARWRLHALVSRNSK